MRFAPVGTLDGSRDSKVDWCVSRRVNARTRDATSASTGACAGPLHQGEASTTFQGGFEMSTTETQAVPAGTWAVDAVHSSVGFAVGYMAGTFTGTFGDFDAAVAGGV